MIESKDHMRTGEDHVLGVQLNLILTVDRIDLGQLIEEVPLEEMIEDVITVRDLRAEVLLDVQIEVIITKHKKM